MRTVSTIVLLLLFSGTAGAQQTVIPNYAAARDQFFWDRVYPNGGETIYCGVTFPGGTRTVNGEQLTVEHTYPADWIAEARGCANRNSCEDPTYKFAEVDLHNLWPAYGRINSSRGDQPFAEIPGETERRFTSICPDYERTSGSGAVVEPRDVAKGELARSILYMAITYNLPLKGMEPLLVRWHEADPPGDAERQRNQVIKGLQGTHNFLIETLP